MPSQAATMPSSPSQAQAERAISMKARPCVEVSSWRSREGTNAAASSAISRKAIASCADAVRCACARNTASQKPGPSPSIAASQSRNDAASVMSPASTAHSMPLEYENAPTGKDGDSQVISRYSAAASSAFIPLPASAGAGSLVIMSMGVIVVVMIVVAMFVVVMVVAMMMVITVVIVIIMMMVAMIMLGMIMSRLRIRATLGIERRFNFDDAR